MIRLLAIIVMLSSVQGAYVSPEQIHLSATGTISGTTSHQSAFV